MIRKTDRIKEIVCEVYLKKNLAILGSGYDISRERLFKTDSFEILESGGEPLLFFSKGLMRDMRTVLFSNILILNSFAKKAAIDAFGEYLKKHKYQNAMCAIEDYLTEELDMAMSLNFKTDHTAARMLNKDIRNIPPHETPEDVLIERFVLGRDENRLADIFNKTFTGLCVPTNLEEINRWERSEKFYSDLYLFAVRGGQTIGFIAIELNAENNTSYLQEIGVLEQFRKKGISGALMRAGFEAALARGAINMGVGALETNITAKDFFYKWNFRDLYKRIFLKEKT